MLVGGIAAVGADSVLNEFSLSRVGMMLVVCGAVVAAYFKLKVRTEENSETYRLGYDIGYEAGYQEARRLTRPVVVDLAARQKQSVSN
jgi:hypothetical protein